MTDTTNAANSSPITAECAANTKYRKKPVVIEAVQYTGHGDFGNPLLPSWLWEALESGVVFNRKGYLIIKTLEGEHLASPGDWIIRGVKGEFYPCKPDIFAQTYEPAAAPQPQGGALTDEQGRAEQQRYNETFVGETHEMAVWHGMRRAWMARATLAQSVPSAPQQAGDGLTREQLAVFRDVTDDLECEIQTRYKGYPEDDRRRVRDFAVVERARALLAAPRQPGGMGAGVQQDAHCQCPACAAGTIHASDCAVHNAPAYPNGPCDCGATTAQQDEREACPECGNPQCFFCYAGAPCGEDAVTRKAKEKCAFETWAFKSEKVGKRKTFDLVSAEAGWMARASHAIGADEHHIIGAFLERTGQYVTNDASREAAIADASAAQQVQADAGAVEQELSSYDYAVMADAEGVYFDEDPAILMRFVRKVLAAHLSPAAESDKPTVDQLTALLPGCYYMDPPDGGSVTLLEQLQRMALDAERYRWLRDGHPADGDLWVAMGVPGFGISCWRNEELDAQIDAAMSREQSQQARDGKEGV